MVRTDFSSVGSSVGTDADLPTLRLASAIQCAQAMARVSLPLGDEDMSSHLGSVEITRFLEVEQSGFTVEVEASKILRFPEDAGKRASAALIAAGVPGSRVDLDNGHGVALIYTREISISMCHGPDHGLALMPTVYALRKDALEAVRETRAAWAAASEAIAALRGRRRPN